MNLNLIKVLFETIRNNVKKKVGKSNYNFSFYNI